MALSLESAVKVKEKARGDTRKPKTQKLLKALFEYIAQHKGNPDLQLVPFDAISTTLTGVAVLADVTAKLYGVFVKSPSGASLPTFFKLTDDETTASTTVFDTGVKIEATKEECLIFPDGKTLASGAAVAATTTMEASTGSAAADRPSGFIIIGG